MQVALATCAGVPPEFDDDELLAEALRSRGCGAEFADWADPDVDWQRFDLVVIRSTWDYTHRREEFLAWRKSWKGDVVGTHLECAEDFRAANYKAPTLLVMGSEGPGLSADIAAACSRLVKIPMAGGLDSLNLAVATALVLYQIRGPQLSL